MESFWFYEFPNYLLNPDYDVFKLQGIGTSDVFYANKS